MSWQTKWRARNPVPKVDGRRGRTYFCGSAGWLTIEEMVKHSGMSQQGIYKRIARGVIADALVGPPAKARPGRSEVTYRERLPSVSGISSDGGGSIFLAITIARRVGDRVPTVAWLRAEFGMSRATAFRWRAAWRAAMGSAP